MKFSCRNFIIIFLIIISCAPLKEVKKMKEEPIIRILLVKNPKKISVSSDFKTSIRTGKKEGMVEGTVKITFNPLKIHTHKGALANPDFPVYLQSTEGMLYLNGRAYPGGFKISKGSQIMVVNHVPVESYLKGVIPHEMGRLPEEQIEALKAQAVAARSYALANRKPRNSYDIVATIWDQVYKGIDRKDRVVDRAVESTRGIVGVYNGKIINAKYSSTCGGITEDNENIWEGNAVPYLRSVRDSGWDGKPFCRFSPHYRWERVYDKKQFFEVVKKQINSLFGKRPETIEWLRISKRTRTDRVRTIEIQTDKGKFYLNRDNIRQLFADFRGSVKSLLFWIKIKGNKIIITGRGYGHGVGMCQYGAMEMAKENYNFIQILHHYYTGIRLARLW